MATPTKTPPLPKTFTVNVPALGGLVTVQALTMAKIQALTPFPYDPVLHTWKIIEAATISPKLTLEKVWQIYDQYGEAPLLRVARAIKTASGMKEVMRAIEPITTALAARYLATPNR